MTITPFIQYEKNKPMYTTKNKLQLIIVIVSTCFSNLFTQSLPDSTIKKIDLLFKKWDTNNSPGCSIGIIRNDSLLFAKGYGMANLEYSIPIKPETIFHMASVSKQFTAYAVVLLAKQGKLKLDDDIHKYLTWFPDLKEKITIRNLLNHTSGIRDQWQLLAISGTRIDDVITQDHIVKILSKQQELNFKPGERYSYSNSGFTMLAEIVKSVTGQSLRQFTDSVIFRPLGMNSTHFHDDYTEIVKNRSYSYERTDSNHFENSILSYSNAGATSLFTNINDMSKWVMNFYHHTIGDQHDIDQLTQKGKLNNNKELNYALGISSDMYRGWKQFSHSGGDAGYRTYITVFPDLKMGFLVFSNLGDFGPVNMAYELANLFIKDTSTTKSKEVAVKLDSTMAVLKDTLSFKEYMGEYISDDGVRFSYFMKNKKVYWKSFSQTYLLIKTEKDTFISLANPEVKFVFSKISGQQIANEYWPDNNRMLKKYISDTSSSDDKLREYSGIYYCPELDCKYGIILKDHHLILTNNKYNDIPLTLSGSDHLFSDYWWISHFKLIRNTKKEIDGFEVNSGRIMHLRFNKIE
ncbi:MAG: serine hydrolase domain-containing protein [Saprospiraceae bacterium]